MDPLPEVGVKAAADTLGNDEVLFWGIGHANVISFKIRGSMWRKYSGDVGKAARGNEYAFVVQ